MDLSELASLSNIYKMKIGKPHEIKASSPKLSSNRQLSFEEICCHYDEMARFQQTVSNSITEHSLLTFGGLIFDAIEFPPKGFNTIIIWSLGFKDLFPMYAFL